MKTCIKNPFLLPALIAGLGFVGSNSQRQAAVNGARGSGVDSADVRDPA